MYYCLTGSFPFAPDAAATTEHIRNSILSDQPQHIGEAAKLYNVNISTSTANIVMQGVQKKMEERFPSAKTMLDAVLTAINWVRAI